MARTATTRPPLTTPVVDYEPPPVGAGDSPPVGTKAQPCPPPTTAALHRRTPRPLDPADRPLREPPAPRAAAVFADAALRRVLEVVDRRRPVAQLRPSLRPNLIDAVAVHARRPAVEGAAVLRRVRLRTLDTGPNRPAAAEVFATYTRGTRVRAIAGRVEVVDGRWQMVALQIG